MESIKYKVPKNKPCPKRHNIIKYKKGSNERTRRCVIGQLQVSRKIFLKQNSIEFTKKNQSVTYLVVSAEDIRLLGYFTLALKPLTVHGAAGSNTTKRKLLRISELDEKSDTYIMSAYLLDTNIDYAQ